MVDGRKGGNAYHELGENGRSDGILPVAITEAQDGMGGDGGVRGLVLEVGRR
jgi:hypothetical protein